MKKTRIAALVISGVCLTGCAMVASQNSASLIEMNYATENAKATGVVQVFDIARNTVVQIKDIESKRPTFLDDSNNELPYKVYGQNAVLTGIHNSFRVITHNATTKITRNAIQTAAAKPAPVATATVAAASPAPTTTAAPISPAIVAEHGNDTPDQLYAEIKRMRDELSELKGLLSQISPQEAGSKPSQNNFQRAPMHQDRTLERSTVVVQFKDNSDAFEPSQIVKSTIVELASDAQRIAVKGYTDSFTPTAQATLLAKLRAMSAREFLVEKGVAPAKISVSYQPSGGFVADNTTKEGKAANRRVEINIS